MFQFRVKDKFNWYFFSFYYVDTTIETTTRKIEIIFNAINLKILRGQNIEYITVFLNLGKFGNQM